MIGWCIRTTLLMAIGELCNILEYVVCMLEWSKNGSLRNPSDQLMCSGFLPSPGHLEVPASDIGFKPAKCNPCDAH